MEKKTIIDLFESSVKRFPGNPFLWEKTGKRFEPTTYSKVRDLVYEEGAGLVSLGVRKGDNMALLSEATPIISTNGPRRHTFGSSGVLVRPLDLKICDMDGNVLPPGEKGEIVIRGENVMAGYWKNPASTADTVKEGWLYTGDMGYMRDGLLYVLGRFKSLLIGSDGEKYSPEGIEEALVEHSSCIDQLILYNNQSPYTTALLVPNKERLRKHLAHQSLDLSSDQGREEAIRTIQRQIDRFRKGGDLSSMFPDRWLPTTFAILPEPFTEQNGMVNSTMKIVRGKVEKAYAARIAQLYTPEGKNPQNKWNKEAL